MQGWNDRENLNSWGPWHWFRWFVLVYFLALAQNPLKSPLPHGVASSEEGKCPCLVPNCSVVFSKGTYWWNTVQISLQEACCHEAMQLDAMWWYQLLLHGQKSSCSRGSIARKEESPVCFAEQWDPLRLLKLGRTRSDCLRLQISRKELSKPC